MINMHPELINTNSKSKKILLEDDSAFVADECPSDRKHLNNSLKTSENSVSENRIEGTKTTIEVSETNGLSNSTSNMKLEILKITLDPIPVIETATTVEHDNNAKYSLSDNGDEVTDTNATGKPYSCYICSKVFSRASSLKCHIGLHLEGTVNSSRKNGAHIPNEASPATNGDKVVNAVDEGLFGCELCPGRFFSSKRGLYRHMGYHNVANRLSKSEETGSDIDLTLADEVDENDPVSDEGEYECSQCGKDFKTLRAMRIHAAHSHKQAKLNENWDADEMAVDEDEELEFPCTCCEKIFHSKRARSIHFAHAHKVIGIQAEMNSASESIGSEDGEADLFKCAYCNLYFRSRRAMNIHAAHRHKQQREKKEKDEEDDSEELEMYSDEEVEKEFECDYCGRVFRSQRARSIHAVSAHRLNGKQLGKMNSHTESVHKSGEKHRERKSSEVEEDELECGVCEKKFTSARAYDVHAEGVCSTAQILDGSYVYVCQECPKTFAHPKSMSRHRRVHRENLFESTDDEEEEVEEEEVEEEEQRTQKELSDDDSSQSEIRKKYQCPYCDKSYPNHQGYAGHMKAHNRANSETARPAKVIVVEESEDEKGDSSKTYNCKYCDRTFNNCFGYAGHMKSHRGEIAADTNTSRRRSTTIDTDPSSSEIDDDSSDDETDQVKMFSCRFCNKKFKSPMQLGGHVRQHMADAKGKSRTAYVSSPTVEDKVYKCDACMQTFTYMSELRRHTTNGCSRKRSFNSRNVNEQFKCPYCDQTFLLQCHLQKHLKSRCNVNDLGSETTEDTANNEPDNAPSNKRVRKSTFLDSLYEYDPIVKTRKNSQKTRKTSSEYGNDPLDDHAHLDTEFANDEYVDIEFPTSEQFVIQNLNGDEEGFVFEQYDDSQGYQCNECDETFRDKLQMIIHMSFHFENRLSNGDSKSLTIKADSTLIAPYKCPFCEERFVNKKYRRRHLCKRHSDNIFKCDICEKLFLFKKTLKQHCKQHLVEEKFHCDYCLKCFTSKWFLKRHMRRQCEKKLALEEQNQSAQMDALSVIEHSYEIDEKINGISNFDQFINVEEVCVE